MINMIQWLGLFAMIATVAIVWYAFLIATYNGMISPYNHAR